MEENDEEEDFANAFDAVAIPGVNLARLSDVRAELGLDKREFDDVLWDLRKKGLYLLMTFDGRHGRLSEDDRKGAITERGRTFYFVARRDVEEEDDEEEDDDGEY